MKEKINKNFEKSENINNSYQLIVFNLIPALLIFLILGILGILCSVCL